MNDNGCFQHCSNCKLSSNCCENFEKINAPVVNQNEITKIKNNTKLDNFYENIDNKLYTLKLKITNVFFL